MADPHTSSATYYQIGAIRPTDKDEIGETFDNLTVARVETEQLVVPHRTVFAVSYVVTIDDIYHTRLSVKRKASELYPFPIEFCS